MRRWAWPTMGSAASLAVPGLADPAAARVDDAVAEVRAWFVTVEAVLSPYRADSDLCRWRTGELPLAQCSPLLPEVIESCRALAQFTEGCFRPYDRAGRFDPTGYVKGWAIERGMDLLTDAGVADACLGIGGDLQLAGTAEGGRPWRVAVVDPGDERRPVAILEAPRGADRFAVATSGSAQRGEHIWAGLDGRGPAGTGPSPRLACVTVVGPDLRLADAFATAVWAGALNRPLAEAWAWLAGTGYEALAVADGGSARTTDGLSRHLVRPAA